MHPGYIVIKNKRKKVKKCVVWEAEEFTCYISETGKF